MARSATLHPPSYPPPEPDRIPDHFRHVADQTKRGHQRPDADLLQITPDSTPPAASPDDRVRCLRRLARGFKAAHQPAVRSIQVQASTNKKRQPGRFIPESRGEDKRAANEVGKVANQVPTRPEICFPIPASVKKVLTEVGARRGARTKIDHGIGCPRELESGL